jgi:hypothetical protein
MLLALLLLLLLELSFAVELSVPTHFQVCLNAIAYAWHLVTGKPVAAVALLPHA